MSEDNGVYSIVSPTLFPCSASHKLFLTRNNNSFSSPKASVVYKHHTDYILKEPTKAVQQSPYPVQLRAGHLNLGSASISDLMVCTTERSPIFSI